MVGEAVVVLTAGPSSEGQVFTASLPVRVCGIINSCPSWAAFHPRRVALQYRIFCTSVIIIIIIIIIIISSSTPHDPNHRHHSFPQPARAYAYPLPTHMLEIHVYADGLPLIWDHGTANALRIQYRLLSKPVGTLPLQKGGTSGQVSRQAITFVDICFY